jgi:hypothetical protein
MSNMEIWNKVKTPPPDALKKINGGRLKGMSDISPQWRYEKMTETFGVCGIGWKYTIDKTWAEPGENGEICAFANISLFVKIGDEWSAAIPATGGSQLIEKEKSGMHTNDEAYKMAITDALGTAMKMIGVAADVYRGRCDTKYKVEDDGLLDDVAPEPPKTKAETPPPAPPVINGDFNKYLESKKVDKEQFKLWLKKEYQKEYDAGSKLSEIIAKNETELKTKIERGDLDLPF